jgi:hypothetical protein
MFYKVLCLHELKRSTKIVSQMLTQPQAIHSTVVRVATPTLRISKEIGCQNRSCSNAHVMIGTFMQRFYKILQSMCGFVNDV